MLDNEPNTLNIVLTAEQQQAIEETKSRLMNLENEIVIAAKNLKAIKSDSQTAIKDKTYQEELFAKVTAQLETAKANLSSIESQTEDSKSVLALLNSEITTKTAMQVSKEVELRDREEFIISEEQKLKEHEQIVIKLTNEQEQDENIFNTKVAKLKEVIKDF